MVSSSLHPYLQYLQLVPLCVLPRVFDVLTPSSNIAFLKICILELKIPYFSSQTKVRHEKAERERRRDEKEAEYCRRVSRKR